MKMLLASACCLLSFSAAAQPSVPLNGTVRVSGTVTCCADTNGQAQPVGFAVIALKAVNLSALSDEHGYYQLDIPQSLVQRGNAVIVFQSGAFLPVELALTANQRGEVHYSPHFERDPTVRVISCPVVLIKSRK